MFGYNYPPTGMGPSIIADEPCATVGRADRHRVHPRTVRHGHRALRRPYTPVSLGRGWKVEVRSGYRLWTTTS
jgi:hypothetical protein